MSNASNPQIHTFCYDNVKKIIQISFLIYMTKKILFNTENEIKQKKMFYN